MSAPTLLKARLRMIERSARVRRYHTESVAHPQNVGEHTYGVMWLVLLLTGGKPSYNLLVAALMHDAAEHATGDIPAPVKQVYNVKVAFDSMEDAEVAKLELRPPTLTLDEVDTLKFADNLEGALFCSSEVRRGNVDMSDCLRNYISYIEKANPSGVALDILNHIKETHVVS